MPSLPAGIQRHGGDHAQQPPVEGHAALPNSQHFCRVAQVMTRLVKQHIPEAPAQHDAQDAEEKQVLHHLPVPTQRSKAGGRRPAQSQEVKQGKCDQVGQPVPMNLQRAQTQGDRVKLRVDQHARTITDRACANVGSRKPGASIRC